LHTPNIFVYFRLNSGYSTYDLKCSIAVLNLFYLLSQLSLILSIQYAQIAPCACVNNNLISSLLLPLKFALGVERIIATAHPFFCASARASAKKRVASLQYVSGIDYLSFNNFRNSSICSFDNSVIVFIISFE